MKLYRDTVYILLFIDILSLFALNVYKDEVNNIWASISISIFTGALLATIISLISYFNERKKLIEEINIKTRNLCFYLYFLRANLIHSLDCAYEFYQGLQILTNEYTIAQIKDEKTRDFFDRITFDSFQYAEKQRQSVLELVNISNIISTVFQSLNSLSLIKNQLDIIHLEKLGRKMPFEISQDTLSEYEFIEKYEEVYCKYCGLLQYIDDTTFYINKLVSEVDKAYRFNIPWEKVKSVLRNGFLQSLNNPQQM